MQRLADKRVFPRSLPRCAMRQHLRMDRVYSSGIGWLPAAAMPRGGRFRRRHNAILSTLGNLRRAAVADACSRSGCSCAGRGGCWRLPGLRVRATSLFLRILRLCAVCVCSLRVLRSELVQRWRLHRRGTVAAGRLWVLWPGLWVSWSLWVSWPGLRVWIWSRARVRARSLRRRLSRRLRRVPWGVRRWPWLPWWSTVICRERRRAAACG